MDAGQPNDPRNSQAALLFATRSRLTNKMESVDLPLGAHVPASHPSPLKGLFSLSPRGPRAYSAARLCELRAPLSLAPSVGLTGVHHTQQALLSLALLLVLTELEAGLKASTSELLSTQN